MIKGRSKAAGGLSAAAVALALLGAAAPGGARAQDAATETPAAGTTQEPAAAVETEAGTETDAAAEPAGKTAAGSPAAETAPDPAAELAPPPPPATKPTLGAHKGPLTVVSWGGVYSTSQQEAIYRPFTRATGIEIIDKVYAGTLDQIRSQQAGSTKLSFSKRPSLQPASASTGSTSTTSQATSPPACWLRIWSRVPA